METQTQLVAPCPVPSSIPLPLWEAGSAAFATSLSTLLLYPLEHAQSITATRVGKRDREKDSTISILRQIYSDQGETFFLCLTHSAIFPLCACVGYCVWSLV